jgi:hypothetical protein
MNTWGHCGREHFGRRRQHCDRSRRQGRTRRPHAAYGRQCLADLQPEHVRQACLRPNQGFCTNYTGFCRGQCPCRAQRRAGQDLARADRARARAQPGKLTYAHAGAGTSQHLGAELLKYVEHLDIQPVAYRGTLALLPDLLAGRVTMSFANIANVAPLVKQGKLRAFAVSSVKRSAVVPELPTMIELGYPGFEAVPWFALMAPAGTSPAIIEKIHRETMRVMAMPSC